MILVVVSRQPDRSQRARFSCYSPGQKRSNLISSRLTSCLSCGRENICELPGLNHGATRLQDVIEYLPGTVRRQVIQWWAWTNSPFPVSNVDNIAHDFPFCSVSFPKTERLFADRE